MSGEHTDAAAAARYGSKRTGMCAVHGAHRPRVSDTDVHHVWPREYGGPDVPENRVEICPTGHRNCHELLREYVHHKGDPGVSVRLQYHPAERALVAHAWEQMVKAGVV